MEESRKEISGFYNKNYKRLLIIPVILLILAAVQIGAQYYKTGDFINKGISLTGGIGIEVQSQFSDILSLQVHLKQTFSGEDFDIQTISKAGRQKSFIVEASRNVNDEELKKEIRSFLISKDPEFVDHEFRAKEISGEFATGFFRTTIIAVLIAFVFMAIVVKLYFKLLIPSLAVVLAAFSDIVITIAIFNIAGLKLAPGSIAAFLMLIGYSVDTDILLSTKALKEKSGTLNERMFGAFKTGLVMSMTTITAVAVAYYFSQADILKQIMTVLFIGLNVDIINTWIQNTAILKWYIEKKERA